MPQEVAVVTQAVPQAPMQIAMISPTKPALASTSGSVFPQAGDSWTYRYIDGWKKDSPQTIVVKATGSKGGKVTDIMSMQGIEIEDERSYEGKPEGVERTLGQGVRVIELLPYVQRSLQEGLTLGQEKNFPDIVIGRNVYRINAKLTRREKTSVPAGTFDALRVDIIGERIGGSGGPVQHHELRSVPMSFAHTLWFAPEIRRIVKAEHKSTSGSRSRLDDDTLELVSFTLQ